MHVDFRRIRMDETIQVDVPIVTVGEPDMEDAVSQIIAESEEEIVGNAVMIPGINTITVEALPRELPSEFTVDLSVLTDFDTVITVADLEVPEGVKLIADSDEMIARMQFVIEVDEEEEEEEEALFGETAEVEVIGRGAEEEEEFFDEEEEEEEI
jgi:large subunit ribosomal protein L25